MAPEADSAFGKAMTLAQWADMPEDEEGEIVDGRLVEEEVPDFAHEAVVGWLIALFRAWVRPRGGFVGGSEAKFAVSGRRGRKPDVSVYFPGRRPPAQGLIRVPPDIMVEILSPRPRDVRRDRVAKLDEYAAFGVRWYWLVDPQARSFEVFELGADGRYTHALGATEGTITDVPGCAGLVLPIDELWAELDSLDPAGAAASEDATAGEPVEQR